MPRPTACVIHGSNTWHALSANPMMLPISYCLGSQSWQRHGRKLLEALGWPSMTALIRPDAGCASWEMGMRPPAQLRTDQTYQRGTELPRHKGPGWLLFCLRPSYIRMLVLVHYTLCRSLFNCRLTGWAECGSPASRGRPNPSSGSASGEALAVGLHQSGATPG